MFSRKLMRVQLRACFPSHSAASLVEKGNLTAIELTEGSLDIEDWETGAIFPWIQGALDIEDWETGAVFPLDSGSLDIEDWETGAIFFWIQGSLDIEDWETGAVIGHGRYGIVWKGLQAHRQVAVKLFSPTNHQHYANERSLLSLPVMQHENIVRFITAGEEKYNTADYVLVTEYYPQGSLHSYLTKHSSDWRNTLNLARTLTTGLSFLHTETWCRGFHKPVIVHRDLTSHNVLVKEGGGCVISDFGVASAMSSRKLETHKTARVYTVGTHRYMAPEILDGSINLRDCTSTLKQADIYSLALILWEIFTRCTDLFS
ncbi:bone morphogenetic protein receptor type-2-like, partial [Heterodontus francisci]|uniref:bone morphogenetic protein receptor type-2-like n=1 Tax=Heterodontus francisci TaxID=7792 RepID=UPI00355B3FAB